MWFYNSNHPLRRYFAGITEHAFVATVGVADPALIDYLSLMLARFTHMDSVHQIHDAQGKPLEEVAEMLFEAEALPSTGRTRREYHRHIGDFTLFWAGLYPEALRRMRSSCKKDCVVDYMAQGKRSYYIASRFEDEATSEEARVLRRLSDEFELCAYGLNQVRVEMTKTPTAGSLVK